MVLPTGWRSGARHKSERFMERSAKRKTPGVGVRKRAGISTALRRDGERQSWASVHGSATGPDRIMTSLVYPTDDRTYNYSFERRLWDGILRKLWNRT